MISIIYSALAVGVAMVLAFEPTSGQQVNQAASATD